MQSLSQLGSSMTAFALTLWLYERTGSSLGTAALTICSYAPYVLMSIFAGALTDRLDKKKTMLACDVLAVLCTVVMYGLYRTNRLMVWHLRALNAASGLMNTVQQPAPEVAMTLIIPERFYQKTSALRSLSWSLVSILNPLLATAVYALAGLDGVVAADVGSFAVAFVALQFFVKIPERRSERRESTLRLAKEGIGFLKAQPMLLTLLWFMAGVNLVASAANATLLGYVLPNPKGSQAVLGVVTSCSGVAMVIGSLLVSALPRPKNRVRVVYWTTLFSMGTENFLLAFSREPMLWCTARPLLFAIQKGTDRIRISGRENLDEGPDGAAYSQKFGFLTEENIYMKSLSAIQKLAKLGKILRGEGAAAVWHPDPRPAHRLRRAREHCGGPRGRVPAGRAGRGDGSILRQWGRHGAGCHADARCVAVPLWRGACAQNRKRLRRAMRL